MYQCIFAVLDDYCDYLTHRPSSLFLTLGRQTLIKASAAALVLNFAGESLGHIIGCNIKRWEVFFALKQNIIEFNRTQTEVAS